MSRGRDARASQDRWLAQLDELVHEQNSGERGVGRIYAKVAKERGLQLHVRVGWLGTTEFITLADFATGEGQYEVELLLEPRLLPELIGHLVHLQRHLGAAAHDELRRTK